jgi:thiol-disulfide isomerase/thioredoxin
MSSSASTEPGVRDRGTPPARRRLLSLVLGLALAAGLWVALTAFNAPGPTRAPHFSLPRLGPGPRVAVPVVGAGAHQAVVLTFFASWCADCHSELPAVARVAREADARGDRVQFIGVDDNDRQAAGLAFAHQSGVGFPVGRDWFSTTAPRYGIPGNPATVFINAAGDVVRTVLGPIAPATLEAEIARIDRA